MARPKKINGSAKSMLVDSKRAYFANISSSAVNEYDCSKCCEKCSFLNENCHITCGIIMKWRRNSGLVEEGIQFGKTDRVVSDKEYYDTTGMMLNAADVAKSIDRGEIELSSEPISNVDSYDTNMDDEFVDADVVE